MTFLGNFFSVPGGNFWSYKRRTLWHAVLQTGVNLYVHACADVDDKKLAVAIRFERCDRWERRKKKDLTGGSGRRKSIIPGRSTGKILCLRRLMLRELTSGECKNALPSVRTMSAIRDISTDMIYFNRDRYQACINSLRTIYFHKMSQADVESYDIWKVGYLSSKDVTTRW